MIVHFPIALIIVGFFAEVVSLFFKSEKCLSKTGFYLMILRNTRCNCSLVNRTTIYRRANAG